MKRIKLLTVLVILTLGLASLVQAEEPKVGDKAPDFTLKDLAGKKVSLKDFRDKVVLLDFWATWCGPCRAVMPHLQEMHKKYKDEGLLVLAVSIDTKKSKVKEFLKKENYSFKVLIDTAGWKSKALSLYKVRGIPCTFIIDKKGVIRFRGHPSKLKEKDIRKYLTAK